MAKKHYAHPYDRAAIREGFSMDIGVMISGIAKSLDMHDETPDWMPEEKEKLKRDADSNREWLLDKARQERFIRSVGILASLDENKLEELIEAKRQTYAEAATLQQNLAG